MSSEPRSLPINLQNRSLVRFNTDVDDPEQISYSNTVVTPWIGPKLVVRKRCNLFKAALGQTLIYDIEIENKGNLDARVRVIDPMAPGIAFLPNSVLRDGVPIPGASPAEGLPWLEIAAGALLRLHFQAIIVAVPAELKLLNQAQVQYAFLTPEGREGTGEEYSNTVEVMLVSAKLLIALQVDRAQTFVGDIVTYSVSVRNPGFVTAEQARVIVSLARGLSFIPGSVVIDDMFAPEVTPDGGIDLGKVLPEAVVIIQFRVQVTGAGTDGELSAQAILHYASGGEAEASDSNVALLQVVNPQISFSKKATPAIAPFGSRVKYELIVSNEASLAVDAFITDALPPGMIYAEGSTRLNGVRRPGFDPGRGIHLGTLTARSNVHVEFEARIAAERQNPIPFELSNQARLNYTFRLPDSRSVRRLLTSNEAVVELKGPIIGVHVDVVPDLVEQGGIVTFHVGVANRGNVAARVQLFDFLPPESTWRLELGPNEGGGLSKHVAPKFLHVGEVQPGSERRISYKVQMSARTQPGLVQGVLLGAYTYEWNGERHAGEETSNAYSIQVEDMDE